MADSARVPGGYRVALNPIQWFATPDGWLNPNSGPTPREIIAEAARAGFGALHAQVPADWTVAEYKAALDDAGLVPAPGYLSVGLPEHGVALETSRETARRSAAQQAGLGLQDMFLSPRMSPDRLARPGVGTPISVGQLDEIIEILDSISGVLKEEGVRGAFHPHIGCWGETEQEARRVLDAIAPDRMGFGPDTGHLSWAGADVAGLIADYRDRIRVVHIKDCRISVRDDAKAMGKTYKETVVGGLWAEPGLGELDLKTMIAALGPQFDGWLIAEVDAPTMPPFASAEASMVWLSKLRRPL